jgi:hypothetical protein
MARTRSARVAVTTGERRRRADLVGRRWYVGEVADAINRIRNYYKQTAGVARARSPGS